jgi:hypothetical protein
MNTHRRGSLRHTEAGRIKSCWSFDREEDKHAPSAKQRLVPFRRKTDRSPRFFR